MSVWPAPRSTLSRPLVTGVAFYAAMASAVSLTRFGGGAAYIWLANAVLLASLTTVNPRRWLGIVVACWIGGTMASGLKGLGWTAAPFITALNIAEPLLAAALVRHWSIHRTGLDSARNLALFILAAGVIAPACFGLPGSLIVSRWTETPFAGNYLHWFVAHALGAITFTPVFVQLAGGEMGRWLRSAGRIKLIEAAILLVVTAATALGVFAQTHLPLLFLPMLPLMLITFRIGRVGSASAVVVIAAIGFALTFVGRGPIALIDTGLGERMQFFQFYLASTVFTVLPVAADLARRHVLFERLRDSEARFRLVTEHSTDVILNLSVDGAIRYASPSIAQLGGYDPARLVGTSAALLIHSEDREAVRETHLKALSSPRKTFTVEYRGVVPGDDERWFETNTRAVVDDDGIVQGVVSAIRETSRRRRQEEELSKAAFSDALTGVGNRRAFDEELAVRLKTAGGACVALFDLDRFKSINDRFGHATGDEVIRAFTVRALAQIRESDLLARVGGEEFAVLFEDIGHEAAKSVCERIRRAIEDEPVMTAAGPVAVTVSIGLARRRNQSPAQMWSLADAALYRSKKSGRNRLSCAA